MIEKKYTKGSIILETSIVLPIFILVILFVYGMFVIISAQNVITHTLIQSSKSLSFDPYITTHVESVAESKTFWSSFSSIILDYARLSNDEYFSSISNWYDEGGNKSSDGERADLAKSRFIGYLAGGDKVEAEKKIKSLGVINGLNGMQFSVSISGNDMTITIKYALQFWFDAFDLGKIPMEQAITVRLWK